MRPAECALFFYNIPVENMKQMKTTTATKVGMSAHCLIISHISYTYQQHTNQFHLWWQSHCGIQTQIGILSSAAPLWGFCCRKRQPHRAVLSDSMMNLNDMCHSADLHGFQQHGCMDVGPVFIPCMANTMEICPRPASCESALITASEGLTVLQRSNAHFAINKGWRLHLLASLLCRGIRQGGEAALWNPGILAFQSSSSGRRTARSGR